MARRAAADGGGDTLTRWGSRFVDRDRELQFRQFVLLKEHRAVVMAGLVLFVFNGALFAVHLADVGGVTGRSMVSQAVTLPLFALAAAALWLARHRRSVLMIYVAVTLLMAASAAMTAANGGVLVTSVLLVVGTVVIYLVGKIDLAGVTTNALSYSVLMTVTWFVVTPDPNAQQITAVMTMTALVHILGFAEARSMQGERRTLFAQQQILEQRATTDGLTGLINRRGFDTVLAPRWQRWLAAHEPFALIMIDIDKFKEFNDAYGHPAGDIVLRAVADAIRNTLPADQDCVGARYGGEEFMCLLPGADAFDVHPIAERIRAAIERLRVSTPGDRGIDLQPVTVSAGVVTVTDGMARLDDILTAVDFQLYAAKHAGRNCVRPRAAEPSARSAPR